MHMIETFGLIKSLIRHFYDRYEVNFYIMSATFPRVLKKELSFLNAQELIPKSVLEAEYKKRKRTKIEFSNSLVKQNLETIISCYRQRKKILVVMNTVRRAQQIFKSLRSIMEQNKYSLKDIMLTHSRYTFDDRRKLEKKIFQYPPIIVATQVIEVSLDIDYDILFTESCYLDSLIQRSGRINRYGNFGNDGQGLVNVFLPEGDLPYDSDMLRNSIDLVRDKAHTISSEWDYVGLTNEFYDQSWQSDEEAEERFETIWTLVRYIYRANLSEERMIELLRTRSGLLTINSYSRSHLQDILALDKQISLTMNIEEKLQLQRRIRMYSINVPVIKSVNFTNINGNDDREYIIAEADYDPDLGLLVDL
jgi:CRISPR-associated endonuclease/helicase Cas3